MKSLWSIFCLPVSFLSVKDKLIRSLSFWAWILAGIFSLILFINTEWYLLLILSISYGLLVLVFGISYFCGFVNHFQEDSL